MTVLNSSFDQAEKFLENFPEAVRGKEFFIEESDRAYVHFNVCGDPLPSPSACDLLCSAIEMVSGEYSVDTDSGNMVIQLPAHFKELPVDDIRHALHDLRRQLLSSMRQQDDQSITILPNPQVSSVELDRLIGGLVNHHRDAKHAHVVESLYEVPSGIRFHDSDGKPKQFVTGVEYDKMRDAPGSSRFLPASGKPPAHHVRFDNHAARALYRELGVDLDVHGKN